MKKTFIIVLFFFISLLTFGQVSDDFSDGDFITNPIWNAMPGDPISWVVENGRLKSNATIANSSFYITTPSIKAVDAQWEFFVNLQFNTSSANYVDVYLTSELADLNSTANSGYFIRIGGTKDEICLYKKIAGSATPVQLINGTDGRTNKSNNLFGIKVTRDVNSFWTLKLDEAGGSNYALEGSASDDSYSTSNFFGIYIQQSTSSFFKKHFFDNFYVGDIIIDTTPPMLESMDIAHATELALVFNEALNAFTAENIANFTVSNNVGNPASASLQSDKRSIKLTFSTPFPANTESELTLSGIKDVAENEMVLTSLHFSYITAVFNDVVINELYPDPSPQIGLPSQEFVEIYNQSSKAINLGGWKLSDPTTASTLPNFQILPGDYVILTSSSGIAAYTSFGNVIGLSNFPSLNNDSDKIRLVNADGLKIDSVSYDNNWYENENKVEGGWTLERLNPQVNTNEPTNWRAADDVLGGTPGKQNSLFGKNPDIKMPELVSLTVINDSELTLEFSESLYESSTQLSLYLVNDIGNPTTVSFSGESRFVQLQFEKHFVNGVDYDLILSGIQDLAGNTMPDLVKSFRYFYSVPSKFKDVIIDEIMADPSPVVQLPEAEYIELFNRTDHPVDLKDWGLTDATATVKLNSVIILPHDFIILTSTSNAYKFSGFGKTMGVSGFPSLNNGGEPIVLKNSLDELIDSVRYSMDWYKDDERSDGGWSLELIDPENSCGEGDNWISAEGEQGGTPGKQNSVLANKPDLTGPKLMAAMAKPDQVLLTFNEKLEKPISPSSFKLFPDVSINNAVFTDLSLKEIQLILASTLATRTSYEVSIEKLHDCARNIIQEDFNRITFALPESGDSLDIVINEVLFNPKPSGVDFIEIYNHSPKFINLKNYKIANYDEEQIKNEQIITDLDLMLSPGEYLAFTEDAVILKNNYPSGMEKNFFVTDLPSLSDDEGSIVLIDDQNHIIDYFAYAEQYHSPIIKDDEGISLERISFSNPTNDPLNWRSANASMGYATPGYLNSNARPESVVDEGAVEVTPEIFSPTAGFNDFASIQYKFEQGGYIASVKIFDQQGRSVKEIINNEPISFEGALRWDGDSSDGSKARNGYYMVWFEVFDLNGNVKTYRKRVVLASQN